MKPSLIEHIPQMKEASKGVPDHVLSLTTYSSPQLRVLPPGATLPAIEARQTRGELNWYRDKWKNGGGQFNLYCDLETVDGWQTLGSAGCPVEGTANDYFYNIYYLFEEWCLRDAWGKYPGQQWVELSEGIYEFCKTGFGAVLHQHPLKSGYSVAVVRLPIPENQIQAKKKVVRFLPDAPRKDVALLNAKKFITKGEIQFQAGDTGFIAWTAQRRIAVANNFSDVREEASKYGFVGVDFFM